MDQLTHSEAIQRPQAQRATLGSLGALAAPVIVSRLCIMIMGVVDTMVVGHFSTNELAALTLGWAGTTPVMVCSIGLLQGVQILAARYFGAGDARAAAMVYRQGLSYGLLISIIFGVIIAAGISPAMKVLQQPAELTQTAVHVALILSASLPLFMVYVAGSFYLEGQSRPLPGMIAMIAANVVNLGLNLWLVGGGFGVSALGAVGSAYATFGARIALAIGLTFYIFYGPGARASRVWSKKKEGGPKASELRRIGYAAGLSQFAEAGAFASMNFIAGWTGALAVASFAIGLNVMSLVFMVPLGLGAATAVLTSQAIGAGSKKKAMHATWLGLKVTFFVCLAIECLIALTPGLIAEAYAADPALRAATASLLLLAAMMVIPDGLQVAAASALRSHGINWFPTYSHLVSYFLVMIPLAIYLSAVLQRGAAGLFEAIIAASFTSGGVLILRVVWLAQSVRRAHG